MASLVDKLPHWLRSLWHMENELRNSARKGLLLRKDEAATHLAEARRHFREALNPRKGDAPPDGPQTPCARRASSSALFVNSAKHLHAAPVALHPSVRSSGRPEHIE